MISKERKQRLIEKTYNRLEKLLDDSPQCCTVGSADHKLDKETATAYHLLVYSTINLLRFLEAKDEEKSTECSTTISTSACRR